MQHQVTGRSAMPVVSYEVAHELNQRAGRLGFLPATRVFGQRMKVYGELVEHGEVVPHPKVVDEGDELARRFIIRASAREGLGRTCCFGSDQKSSCHTFPANENVRDRYPLFPLPTRNLNRVPKTRLSRITLRSQPNTLTDHTAQRDATENVSQPIRTASRNKCPLEVAHIFSVCSVVLFSHVSDSTSTRIASFRVSALHPARLPLQGCSPVIAA